MAIRPFVKKIANKGSRVIDCSSAVLFWSPIIVGLYLLILKRTFEEGYNDKKTKDKRIN
jgi:hypothetical protein